MKKEFKKSKELKELANVAGGATQSAISAKQNGYVSEFADRSNDEGLIRNVRPRYFVDKK